MQFHKNVNRPSGKDDFEVFPEGRFLWNRQLYIMGTILISADRGVRSQRDGISMMPSPLSLSL